MNMRLVAVGDSVVWGQGLRTNEKFAVIFYRETTGRDWQNDTGTDLSDFHARSGAIIGTLDGTERARASIRAIADKMARHEVPSAAPTVIQQLRSLQGTDAEQADFVILVGGANDFSISSRLFSAKILSKEFGPRAEVERLFHTFFDERARTLIDTAVATFPKATIAMCGYYPILSSKSILSRMPAMFLLQWLGIGIGGPLPFVGVQLAFKRAKRQAMFFHRSQLRLLRRVIAEKAAQTGRRLLFVHPRFSAHNAIAAWRRVEQRFVFELNTPNDQQAWIRDLRRALADNDHRLFFTLVTNIEPQRGDHPVAVSRRQACDIAYPFHGGDDASVTDNLTCRIAPVGHPTAEGSRQIARSLGRVAAQSARVSMRETLTALGAGRRGSASARRTLRYRPTLDRFNLPIERGFWFCSQLLDIDVIEVVIRTSNRRRAGTDGMVFLDIGGGKSWRLNEDIFQHDFHNDFKPGATDSFAIDPALDGDKLQLGDIRRIRLKMRANFDLTGPWKPAHITLRINGWTVYESQIRENISPRTPWTAADYPR